MTTAAILTRWIGDGLSTFTARRPELLDQFPTVSYEDITTQDSANIPPSPNAFIVKVDVSDATLTAIKADARYGNASVLWEGDPSLSPVMTTNANNVLVNFLANKFNTTTTQVQNILTSIGAVVDGVQTRYDFAVKIIGWLRNRPHQ